MEYSARNVERFTRACIHPLTRNYDDLLRTSAKCLVSWLGALVHAANGHIVLLKTSTYIETRFSLCSVWVECKE